MWPFQAKTVTRSVLDASREETRLEKGRLAENVVTLERRSVELNRRMEEILAELDRARQ